MSRMGDMLTKLFVRDLNCRMTANRSVTSGADYNPEDEEVATKVAVLLVPVTSAGSWAALLVGVNENYDHQVTHLALCQATDDVQIGFWLTESDHKDDLGRWRPVALADRRRFLVMDKEVFGAISEPTNQVRLVLWRTER